MRGQYGTSQQADRIIFLTEGNEVLKRIIYHEETILNHQESLEVSLLHTYETIFGKFDITSLQDFR